MGRRSSPDSPSQPDPAKRHKRGSGAAASRLPDAAPNSQGGDVTRSAATPAGSGLTDAASDGTAATEPMDDAASAEVDAAAAMHLQLFAETQYMDAETQLFTASEDTQPLPQQQSSQVRCQCRTGRTALRSKVMDLHFACSVLWPSLEESGCTIPKLSSKVSVNLACWICHQADACCCRI